MPDAFASGKQDRIKAPAFFVYFSLLSTEPLQNPIKITNRRMKHPTFLASFALLLATTACGGAKQAQARSDYQYQQWTEARNQQAAAQNPSAPPQQEAPSQYQQRPTRTMRVQEPCIKKALEPSGSLRAYGAATSYVEKAAMAEAERNARNRLAQMIRISVEGAAQDYIKNTSENLNNTAKSIGEQVMSQFVMADIKDSPVIEATTYDLSDGSVQIFVCVEMRKSQDEMAKKIENGLAESAVVRAEQDRERFISKMKDGMAEYKARLAAEAEAQGL